MVRATDRWRRRVFAKCCAKRERGVVIVATTQCWHGAVTLGAYEASLASAGVTTGLDLTAEAALAKLFYLFSRGEPPAMVREKMLQNMRGELSSKGAPRGAGQ